MDRTATVDAPAPPEELFRWVEDLGRYPSWLDIVVRAVPDGADADGPAWVVDLRGRVGPLARSKRLRMVRVGHEPPSHVRFERRERDGRTHSPWVLAADLRPWGGGSRLTMRLHYGGALFGPVLDRLLAEEIERSRPRLLRRVTAADRRSPGG